MVIVASGALIADVFAAPLLHAGQVESLNLRGLYLELPNDAFGAGAALVAGLLILLRTCHLLREAINVLLEATPKNVDMNEVREHILQTPGVLGAHDLHALMVTSGQNLMSAHVIIDQKANTADVSHELCRGLATQFDIEHSSFHLEREDRPPLEHMTHRWPSSQSRWVGP